MISSFGRDLRSDSELSKPQGPLLAELVAVTLSRDFDLHNFVQIHFPDRVGEETRAKAASDPVDSELALEWLSQQGINS